MYWIVKLWILLIRKKELNSIFVNFEIQPEQAI